MIETKWFHYEIIYGIRKLRRGIAIENFAIKSYDTVNNNCFLAQNFKLEEKSKHLTTHYRKKPN